LEGSEMNAIVLFLRSMGEYGMAEEVEAEHARLEAFADGLDKDCLEAQFKAGAASRDAEIERLSSRVGRLQATGARRLVGLCRRDAKIEQLRQQLAERDKHVTMLRDALRELVALKNLKDQSESAEDSSTHNYCGTEYRTRKPAAWKAAREALDATAYLNDVIMCHAEPVVWQHEDDKGCLIPAENKGYEDSGYSIALYRAREPK
jgi:hypothetical protein